MVIDENHSPSDVVSIVDSEKPVDPLESEVHLLSVEQVKLPPAEAKDQKHCDSPKAERARPFKPKSPTKVSRDDLKYKPSPKHAVMADGSHDALSIKNASVALSAMTAV